jgi:hypothetical protein
VPEHSTLFLGLSLLLPEGRENKGKHHEHTAENLRHKELLFESVYSELVYI